MFGKNKAKNSHIEGPRTCPTCNVELRETPPGYCPSCGITFVSCPSCNTNFSRDIDICPGCGAENRRPSIGI